LKYYSRVVRHGKYNLEQIKSIVINKTRGFFSCVLNYLTLALRTPNTSFRMIVGNTKEPLGINFKSRIPAKLKNNKKVNNSNPSEVKEAYLKEYLELVHNKKQKKAKLSTLGTVLTVVMISLVVSSITTILFPNVSVTEAAGEAWVSGYTYRREITIDNTKVATTSDAFVVLATTTLASLKTTGNGGLVTDANGYDIVWTDSDGSTLLDFEVEKYDATTGEIVHWIETDVSSTTDKVLYMYYGNSDISTDQATTTGTWANDSYVSDYAGVWHMDNAYNASSTDSTSNANNGSMMNQYSATSSVTGIADTALDFDGSDDYVGATMERLYNFTISAWVNFDDISDGRTMIVVAHEGRIWLNKHDTNNIRLYVHSLTSTSIISNSNSIDANRWIHVVGVYNGTNILLYFDGVLNKNVASTGIPGYNGPTVNIGGDPTGYYTNGSIDEVRISNIARTDADILTEYTNQVAVSEFMTFGAESQQNNSPLAPSILTQYWSTTTREIVNGDYTSEQSIDLYASTTDSDTTETITMFFEVQESATAFTSSSTPTTAVACASDTAFADCASKVWFVTSASGDYSATPYTTTTTVSGLVDDTNYKWQAKACDDAQDGPCSSWVAYNATTPNFGRDDFFGMAAKRVITIDNTKVTTNLTNFPMLFSTTLDDMKATSSNGRIQKTDATDIVFTSSDGTYLDYEIEKYTSSTGELIAWVEVDSVSSTTDTTINMYYGDLDSVDHSTTTGVWASDYTGVWHLGAGDDVTDSTSNANNGTAYGNASSTDNLVYNYGKFGEAFVFDGDGDYVNTNTKLSSLLSVSDGTMSVWVKPTGTSPVDAPSYSGQNILSDAPSYISISRAVVGGNDKIWVSSYPTSATQIGVNYTNNEWIHIIWMHTGGVLYIYNNGVLGGSIIAGDIGDISNNLLMGRGYGQYFNGSIDEVRISSSARSAQYIETIYNSQSSTSTFYAIGVETPNTAPATPTLSQYYGGSNTAQIVNGEYINASTVMLQASTTDSDTSEALTVYFEVASTTQSFNSPATPTVATSCTSATTRANCATSIWYAQPSHGDYSGGTTTQVVIGGIASSTSIMWQSKACDDDGGCSGWTAFNATTPNFTNYLYFGNSYYKVITIDNTKVTSNLTNFPVLYSVTDSNLRATTSGGYVGNLLGNDILFANSSGEKLYHEIDEYDSTTGVLTAWVNLDSISSTTDTVISMYYGSSTIPIQSSSTATWASDYAGVWHLGTGDNMLDSTSNNNDGTAYGNASSTDNLVYGSSKIGDAFAFDGAEDYIDVPHSINDQNESTISVWINMDNWDDPNNNGFIVSSGINTLGHLSFYKNSSNIIYFKFRDPDRTSRTVSQSMSGSSDWHHFIIIFSKENYIVGSNYMDMYIDGSNSGMSYSNTNSPWDFYSDTDFRISSNYFNGSIDEVTISNTVRSAQYISTSYNNQNSTSTFYSIGSHQSTLAPSNPTLVSPADSSNTADNTPTLSANYTDPNAGDVGTTNYRISSISAQDCLDNGTIADSGASSETATINESTSYTPSSSIGSDGTYYWCARNNDGVALSAWTTMGSFTLDTVAPTNITIDVVTVDSSTQITVISASSTDATVGVHPSTYWFNETSDNDGGTDSTTYQGSKTYIDTGLTPNTQYSYQVRAQDLVSNISSYSTVVASTTVYTLANIPITPTIAIDSTTQLTATWGANSNPSGTNYYIENTTHGTNSGWTANTSWTSNELNCNTSYNFTVKAKNAIDVETATVSANATTGECPGSVAGLFSALNPFSNTQPSDTTTDVPPEVVVNDPKPITSEDLTIEDIEELEDLGILPEEEIILPQEVSDALFEEEELIDQELDLVELIQDIPLVINELGIEGLDLIDLSMEQLDEIAQYALLSNDLSDLTKQFPSLGDTLDNTNIDLNIKKDLENIKGISFTLPGITNSALSSGGISPSQLASEVTRTTKVTTNSISGKPIVALISKATPLEGMSKVVKEAIPEDLVFVRTSDEFIDISTKVEITSNNKIEKKLTVSSNQDLKLAIKPTNNKDVEGVKGYLILKEIDRTSMNDTTKPVVRNTWLNSLISPVYAMDLRLPRISGNRGRVLGEQDSLLLEDGGQKEALDPKPDQLLVLMEFDYLDEDNDGIYTTGITTPPVEGTFEILTAISYKYQKVPKIVKLTTIIDPEGYVYGQTDMGKARIENAKVSLYLQTSENEYVLWPASEFNQENPQITTDNGKYSFLVPEGTYYLTVEANNYHSYQSNTFEVREGENIHENVELKVIHNWWSIFVSWKFWMTVGIIVFIILITVIIIVVNKLRRR